MWNRLVLLYKAMGTILVTVYTYKSGGYESSIH